MDKATFSELSHDTIYLGRGHACFKLTPKSEPITKCKFKWKRVNFIVKGSVIDRTVKRDFKVKYPDDYDSHQDSICVTSVSLLNGKEYSIYDLQIPEPYKEDILWYVLSNRDSSREAARNTLLNVYFWKEHKKQYIKESDYMSEQENDWKRSHYSREMDFVNALKKLE